MTRDKVVQEALTWLGTPYHSHARIKGVGVDCAQLPVAVYVACGLIDTFNPNYDAQWHMHRDEELYLDFVKPHAKEIDPKDVQAGDFLIWRFGRTYSHGAIVINPPRIIHAYIDVGVTIDNYFEHSELANRPMKAFTLF